MGKHTVKEYVSGDLCRPIVLERCWIDLFLISVCYVVFWRAAGYSRQGLNHSHSIVPGGFDVTS